LKRGKVFDQKYSKTEEDVIWSLKRPKSHFSPQIEKTSLTLKSENIFEMETRIIFYKLPNFISMLDMKNMFPLWTGLWLFKNSQFYETE
jgi:hypothetical protein